MVWELNGVEDCWRAGLGVDSGRDAFKPPDMVEKRRGQHVGGGIDDCKHELGKVGGWEE